jgi:hypothetical protein
MPAENETAFSSHFPWAEFANNLLGIPIDEGGVRRVD